MSVTTSELPRLLAQVTPHISTDTTLPPICGVYLEADGTQLLAAATDRFTFALARCEAAETEPWTAFLAHADLAALRALVPSRRRPADLHLTHSRGCTRTPDGVLTIGDGSRALNLSANASLARKFPKWRRLFADALAAEPHQDTEALYNARFLARWAKAAERHQPLTTWSAGPGKPLVVAAGPDFLGLHMPISLPDHRPETPVRQRQDRAAVRTVWADTITPAAPARRLKAA